MKTLRFGELEIDAKFITFNQELIKTEQYNAVTTGNRNVRNFLFSKQNLVKEIKPSITERLIHQMSRTLNSAFIVKKFQFLVRFKELK